MNVPIDTSLATLEAVDPDSDSATLQYRIENVTFRLVGKSSKRPPPDIPVQALFSVDKLSGELRTLGPMRHFADGYFDILVIANNTDDPRRWGNVTARVR